MALNLFKKNKPSASFPLPQGEAEEYSVETFVPQKIVLTDELIRRKKEEELKKKYCYNK